MMSPALLLCIENASERMLNLSVSSWFVCFSCSSCFVGCMLSSASKIRDGTRMVMLRLECFHVILSNVTYYW